MRPHPRRPTAPGACTRSARAALVALVVLGVGAGRATAQDVRPITRAEAVQRALAASPRGAALVADTLAAAARVRAARALPNPTLTASYSRSVPQQHFTIDLPLDLPYVRGPRVRAASAARRGAQLTFAAERAALELEADTLYTRAQGALLRGRLSAAGAADARRLLQATEARRTAGDASDLEVNLARVSADQAANTASADSLEAVDALLELQAALALRTDVVLVTPADSLAPLPAAPAIGEGGAVAGVAGAPPTTPAPTAPAPSTPAIALPPGGAVRVQAAAASVTAAQQQLLVQRRSVFSAPALQLGVEHGDPTGAEPGALPTFGIALPLPLFNRNGGEIAVARAELARAEAELVLARREAEALYARVVRTRRGAVARLARDSATVAAATRNTALTTRGYTEGELGIADVLEARRAQRDAETQYVNDLVAARVSDAMIRVLTTDPAIR